MPDLQVAPEAAEPMTRESLMPEGWDKPKQPEAAELPVTETEEEEVIEEDPAEAQGEEDQEEAAEVPEAVLERMELNRFLKEAGVTLEEFYRDVYKVEDGKEVSMSAAWDERKALKEANDALIRERSELQERLNQSSTTMPSQEINPEAQSLAHQAQLKLQALQTTDWSQLDPGQAANMKVDLQMQAQELWGQAQAKQAEHQVKLKEQAQKVLEEADRQTRALIPEWNDATIRQREWSAIADMVSSYGISRQELDATINPRWRRVLRDAMLAKGEQKRIASGVKTVRKIGKVLGSGSRGTVEKKKPTLKDAKQSLAEARKSGATLEELNRLRLNMPLG